MIYLEKVLTDKRDLNSHHYEHWSTTLPAEQLLTLQILTVSVKMLQEYFVPVMFCKLLKWGNAHDSQMGMATCLECKLGVASGH